MKRRVFALLTASALLAAFLLPAVVACRRQDGIEAKPQNGIINPDGKTIEKRINAPEGYARAEISQDGFAHFLRSFPLKPHGSKVFYYNGQVKPRDVYEAVFDLDIGDKNLQQCADAVIRLRAEYLYAKKDYAAIHFNFTNGFRANYSKWLQGYRIRVRGNEAVWVKSAEYSDDYEVFLRYLETVFMYAGTLSLSQELRPQELEDMEAGDVFIQGGSPGHCAIIVDMAENSKTGERIFLLAQSYMPAQDIHILKNPRDENLSPWYSADFDGELITPEWTFRDCDLKRFD